MKGRTLRRLVAAFLVAMLVSSAEAQQADVMKMTIATIAPGLHVISGFANGNILVVEGGMELLLVDAQSAKRVPLADSVLRTITQKPVRQVVFTHYHEDHTQGMPYWRTRGAFAVAHASVGPEMKKDTTIAERKWHRVPEPPEAMPDLTFTDSLKLDLSGSRLWLHHIPNAHTNGDAVVIIPWANVMHVGDLVEPGGPPFIDFWAGGSVQGMIAAADWILSRANDSTRIVPGHGPVIGRAAVEDHKHMLITVRDRVGVSFRAGKTEAQVVAELPAKEFETLLGGPRMADEFVKEIYYSWKLQSQKP